MPRYFCDTIPGKDTFVGKGMQLNHGGFDTGASLLYDSFLGKKFRTEKTQRKALEAAGLL
jgi:hypothetical protein